MLSLGSGFFWGFLVFVFCFLGLHLQHVEVLRPGDELELQLLAYTTATAMQDLRHVCDTTAHSNDGSLSEARDQTLDLMDTSQAHYH